MHTLSADEQRLIKIRDAHCLVGVSLELLAALEKGGKEFKPIARPKGYRRLRKQGDCFKNASLIVLRDHWRRDAGTPATYVEGIAWSSEFKGVGFHHAWVTLDGEHAIDQTWPTLGAAYVGVPVPAEQLAGVLSRTGYYGSIITRLNEAAS